MPMTELLKSDIFFLVTTIVVVIVAVLLVTLLLYIIRVVRDVKKISGRAREEVDNIADDIGFIRRNIKKGGRKVKKVVKNIKNK